MAMSIVLNVILAATVFATVVSLLGWAIVSGTRDDGRWATAGRGRAPVSPPRPMQRRIGRISLHWPNASRSARSVDQKARSSHGSSLTANARTSIASGVICGRPCERAR
jgi:hypothetical protein